jgi:hypothetical protein
VNLVVSLNAVLCIIILLKCELSYFFNPADSARCINAPKVSWINGMKHSLEFCVLQSDCHLTISLTSTGRYQSRNSIGQQWFKGYCFEQHFPIAMLPCNPLRACDCTSRCWSVKLRSDNSATFLHLRWGLLLAGRGRDDYTAYYY